MYRSIVCFAMLCGILGCASSAPREPSPILATHVHVGHERTEATGTHYAIATQGDFSTRAAQSILDQGGNIMDAAVAASFAIAVERPQSTGLGGGGFMLYHDSKSGKTYAIDFRERAPIGATEKMYLKADGTPDPALSRNGMTSVAVPGLVAGLLELHKKFGALPLSTVMQPAIGLAETGFPIYEELEHGLVARKAVLEKDPAARKIFLDPHGEPWVLGHLLIQKDLAKTLRLIVNKGRDGFYRGSVAKSLIDLSERTHGLISQNDLDQYEVKYRDPVTGRFHGLDVVSMPPPSSGGTHVIQFLNFLEHDDLKSMGLLSAKSIHLAASSLQSAFADRSKYLGDPDFVKIPIHALTSQAYADSRRKEVKMDRARHVTDVGPGELAPYESTQTTHFSIMDAQGDVVSSTQTINGLMGSATVIPGTGVVLNNEMDDFSALEGSQNMFGAVGGKPNAIAPRKTPLSSMSPTILLKDGRPVMSVGAPGGTRIISCVAQTILNYVEFKQSLYNSVAMIRYHHQWQPDVLDIDPPGPAPEDLKKLQEMGYDVRIRDVPCKVMAVSFDGVTLDAVADPRDIGTSAAK